MFKVNQPFYFYVFIAFVFASSVGCTQQIDSKVIKDTPPDLANVALINEVWYEDNQQYIHPSFTYAGTGFLIDTKQGVLAATAKHVLMIANPKGMKGTSPNAHLEKWILHPKNNNTDSVVIGQLLNEDKEEILGFDKASIQLRDWIVFSTQYHSPNIKTLIPRFTPLKIGEAIYFTGCPYKSEDCIIEPATVLGVKGNRIIFSQENKGANIGGASGSPLVDAQGKLVGVLSGTSVSPKDGEDALFGISTHYLEKILKGDKNLNQPVTTIEDFLTTSIAKNGVEQTIQQYQNLKKQPDFYFNYFVSPEGINGVADQLLENVKMEDALQILALSKKEHGFFSDTYTLQGKVYLAKKDVGLAKQALTEALRLWPENETAQKLMEEVDQ